MNNKVILLDSLNNIGENTYDAFNNQCPKKTVAIMIDEGEKFYDENSLQKIVKYFEENLNYYLLASSVEINGTVTELEVNISHFRRYSFPYYSNKQMQKKVYNKFPMHVRAIKTDYYRDILPFDLLTTE